MVGPTYKNGMKNCREWYLMVYRTGDDHQLPVEGKVECEGKKEGWSSGNRTGQQEGLTMLEIDASGPLLEESYGL